MFGEMIVLLALGLLALPVLSLVLSIKALNTARRVEERLDAMKGALRSGASALKSLGTTESVPPPPAAPTPAPVETPPAPPPFTGLPAALAETENKGNLPSDPFGSSTAPSAPAPLHDVTPAPVFLTTEAPASPPAPAVNWEQFTGIKLFSWIGGFALFLGAIFFAKYSMDHGWITPAMRIASGLVAGVVALLLGLKLKNSTPVTAQTLAAAGPAILYATIFAAHARYGFVGPMATFGFLSLVTVLAFLLSDRFESRYIALLALVGGFLTPPILSTGVDRPLGLFAYITLLNLGLLAVVLKRGWGFLWGLGGVGTAMMIVGWHDKFFALEKMPVAAAILLWFPLLYVVARFYAERRERDLAPFRHAAGLVSLLAILLGGQALGRMGDNALLPFVVLLSVNILTAALAMRPGSGSRYHLAAGGLNYLILLVWTSSRLTGETLPLALGAYLVFGALHGALSVILHRRGAPRDVVVVSTFFPVVLLLPLALGVLKNFAGSFVVWPVLFGINIIAVLAALATGVFWGIALALGFTFFAVFSWIDRLTIDGMSGFLVVVGGMAALFFGVGAYLLRRSRESKSVEATPEKNNEGWSPQASWGLSAASALLPFQLLAVAANRLAPADPSALFGLGALLLLLFLGLARRGASQDADEKGSAYGFLVPVSLLCAALLEYSWHAAAFRAEQAFPAVYWYAGFTAFFWLLPFVARRSFGLMNGAWGASALAGLLHGVLFYRAAMALGYVDVIGFLPALGAVFAIGALVGFLRRFPEEDPARKDLLALFGGVALLFISLIFPLQFKKEWITLGWALEGVALLWFYRRVDHPGLKAWAFALLAIAFARLALNSSVMSYHPRSGVPLVNWFLYTYGLTAACQFVAARLWSPSDQKWGGTSIAGLLNALGGILVFLLMNIQIADYFSTGAVLTFDLRGSLAQDLAYTLAWGGFGLGLLLLGLHKESPALRKTSFALLGVTIGKLFLHDVWRLPLLYRAAAFVGLAVVLILGSFLYQKHIQSRGQQS